MTMDEICRKYKETYRPYTTMWYYGHRVELISYPWVDDANYVVINARIIPGDPTTMETIRVPLLRRHYFGMQLTCGTLGFRIGGTWVDFFVRPYFGMFVNRLGTKTWRRLPSFKIVRCLDV